MELDKLKNEFKIIHGNSDSISFENFDMTTPENEKEGSPRDLSSDNPKHELKSDQDSESIMASDDWSSQSSFGKTYSSISDKDNKAGSNTDDLMNEDSDIIIIENIISPE